MPRSINVLRKTYADCFKTIDGEKVLQDLRANYQMRESFVTSDPYKTAFNEGARSVYLRIMTLCNRRSEDE